MADDTGILSLDQAAAALSAPAEEERQDAAPARPAKAAAATPPATADNAQPEGADAEEGVELEVDREALLKAAGDATNADAEDTGDSPSVDPPTGWTAEDQAWFKTLPPDKQEILAKRERDLRANESRRHQEHQAARAALDAEVAAARTERQNLSAALKTYADPLIAEFEREFPDLIKGEVDLRKIQAEDPIRFQKLQAYQMEFSKIQNAQRAIEEKGQAESEALWRNYRAAENAKLVETVPGLNTPEARAKFDAEITGYLRNQGIPDNLIRNASATQLTLARKAMLYDKAMAAKPTAKPAARVQRPGTAPSKGERANDGVAASLKRLDRTGRLEDALALMRQ